MRCGRFPRCYENPKWSADGDRQPHDRVACQLPYRDEICRWQPAAAPQSGLPVPSFQKLN